MEQTPQKKSVNLYLIFAAIVIIALLGIGYFVFAAPSSVPREFFSKYQEQDTLVKQTIPKIQYDYGLLSQQIQSQNATAAGQLAKDNLVQSLKNQKNAEVIQKKTTELKRQLVSVRDATLREKILKLFELLDERNKKMQEIVKIQTDVFTALRNYFGAAAVGAKVTPLPQNIDAVIQASQTQVQSVQQLQTTIDLAYEEIVKLSGVDPTALQTVDLIKMNLSATPEVNPTITDFPTPTITPTVAATPTPQASPSATASPSAN